MPTSDVIEVVVSFALACVVLVPSARASDELIGCDATITRQLLSRELDRIRLDFDVAEDEIVRIDIRSKPGQTGFSPVWRLVDGHATPVTDADCDDFKTGAKDCGPLDATGAPYFIEVSDSQGDPGDYVARLQRLTEAVACERVPIGCDVALDGRIDVAGDTDLVRIGDVLDGARVGIAVGGPGSHWRLLDRAGIGIGATFAPHGVCRSTFGSDSASSGPWDCGALPASRGPYVLEVRGDVGDYQVSLQGVPAGTRCESHAGESAPLGCDEVRMLTIGTRADSDFIPLGFSVADGEILDVSVFRDAAGDAAFDPRWRLLRADGIPVEDDNCDARAAGYQSCGPLDASGNPYAIHVFDSDLDAAGSYRVHVQRLTAPNVCEDAARCRIDDPAETDLVALGLDAIDGQFVAIDVRPHPGESAAFVPRWRLIDRHGFPAALAACSAYGTANRSCGPLLASDAPYNVEIQDGTFDSVGRYEVRIDGAPVCSSCGNGIVERRETCDPGASEAGSCCRDCRLAPNGTECRAPRGSCDVAETCDGTTAQCPGDRFAAAGIVCREAGGACDAAEACSGVGPSCPSDALTPGVVCRPIADTCDLAERCSGATTQCPADLRGAAIDAATMKLGKRSMTGRFVLDGTPAALHVDPVARGFALTIAPTAVGATGLALAIPPGAIGANHCGPKDGWKAARNGLGFTYVNRTGALPSAGCAPGSAAGLRTVKVAVKPRRKEPLRSNLTIVVAVKAPFTTALATGEYAVSVDLGDDAGLGPICPDKQLVAAPCVLASKPKGRMACASELGR